MTPLAFPATVNPMGTKGWHFPAGLVVSLIVSGCAATSVTGGATARGGLGADTRVFLDSACLPDEGAQALDPFSTLGEIAVGAGSVIFNSVGRYIEELGQPDLDASVGMASDLFYAPARSTPPGFPFETAEDEAEGPATRKINRQVTCIHIVRSGFERGPRVETDHPQYGHLELLSEPSLYALIELVPSPDGSAVFRGELRHLELNRFVRAGGELSRDLVISLEFGGPADSRVYTLDEFGAPQAQAGGSFAVGAFQLPGVEGGRVFSEAETKGLVTSWMNTPPSAGDEDQFPFNLYVDIVETKRGNPFLQDIGRVLQSDPVVTAVEYDLRELVYDDSERRRQRRSDEFEQRRLERELRRALEDETRILEALLDAEVDDEDTLVASIRSIEDAIEDIERHTAIEGWET
ncbi:MAG: hypothetical protein AAFQ84_03480, partial [Pseudomonadota bacterium]